MTEQIGAVAGEVWRYLSDNGEATPSKLIAEIDKPERTILMAVGWLAREEQISFREEGRVCYITVSESDSDQEE